MMPQERLKKNVGDLKSNLKISSLSSDPNLNWFSSLTPVPPLLPTSHSAHPHFPVPSLEALPFSPLLLFKHIPFTKQCPFMSYIRGKDDDQVCWPHSLKRGQDQVCIMSLTTICGEGRIFPGGSDDKACTYSVGDLGSIPGSGRRSSRRIPREGNGKPLQYSCLENPMDGGAR